MPISSKRKDPKKTKNITSHQKVPTKPQFECDWVLMTFSTLFFELELHSRVIYQQNSMGFQANERGHA